MSSRQSLSIIVESRGLSSRHFLDIEELTPFATCRFKTAEMPIPPHRPGSLSDARSVTGLASYWDDGSGVCLVISRSSRNTPRTGIMRLRK